MRTGFISRILGKQAKLDKEILLDCLLEVAEERDLLNLIFDGMTEGVLVLDEQEALRFANRRAGELLNFDVKDHLRRPLGSFLSEPEIIDPIRSCLRTGENVREDEVIILHRLPGRETTSAPHHELRALRIEIEPFNITGAVHETSLRMGALVMLLEVTEQKKREAELRETKRLAALATLSASLAHEIRNPLNSMSIHVQLLERQLKKQGREDLVKTTTIIRDEITNLNDRLTRFLDAARPRKPQYETLSVHALLEETLALLKPELLQADITTKYYAPSVHTTLFGDRIDLSRAFVNILKNAIEAMPDGGTLTITTQIELGYVVIEFRDTGQGIPADIIERVLELGFSTKDTGSGLGLAQVDRCIREHFGDLQINPQKGGGTLIRIRLPVVSVGKQLLPLSQKTEEGM
jgi:signal transduction histidine kinase